MNISRLEPSEPITYVDTSVQGKNGCERFQNCPRRMPPS